MRSSRRVQPLFSLRVLGQRVAMGWQAAKSQGDPLASWNDGLAKDAVLRFVRETASTNLSPKYAEPADRIATFDQDGTLWTEHPIYGQGAFGAGARGARWRRSTLIEEA